MDLEGVREEEVDASSEKLSNVERGGCVGLDVDFAKPIGSGFWLLLFALAGAVEFHSSANESVIARQGRMVAV